MMAKRTRSKKTRKSSETTLESLINFVEKDRFTILTALLYIIIIGVIRSVSESYAGAYPGFGIHLLTQHVMFYFAVFFTGAVAISILGDIDIKTVLNVQLFGFWINMVPAFFDLLIYGRGFTLATGYNFLSVHRVLTPLYWIDPFYALENTSIGLKTMLILMCLLPAMYVATKWYLKPDEDKTGTKTVNIITRGVATFYAVWFVIAWIGGMLLFINIDFHTSDVIIFDSIRQPILQAYYTGISPWGDAFFMVHDATFLIIQQRSLYMILDYVIFLILSIMPTLYLWKKDSLKIIIRSLDPLFLVYSALAYLIGILLAGVVQPAYILHWPYVAFGYLVFVCTWEAVRLSTRKQKETISKKRRKKKQSSVKEAYLADILGEDEYRYVPYALLIFAAIFAVNLGPLSIIMIAVLLAAGAIYLKSDAESSTATYVISLTGLLAFVNGIITPSMWYIKEWDNNYTSLEEMLSSIKTVVYYRSISITPEMIIMGTALFFIGLGLSLITENLFSMYRRRSLHKNFGGIFFLSTGMLLPLFAVASDIPVSACISLLFIINYLLVSSSTDEIKGKEKMDEIGGEKASAPRDFRNKENMRTYAPTILVILELILIALKYSGML